MKEIILIKNGEIALKGLNRGAFEDVMVRNIRRRLKRFGEFEYKKAQLTVTITPISDNIDLDEVVECIKTIFGIAVFSRAAALPKDFEEIKSAIKPYVDEELSAAKTFKVVAKRSDKRFPMSSMEIACELGGHILDLYPDIKVDVHNPEVTVYVEVREREVYLYAKKITGAGGMPVSSSGRAMLLLSGGIDSPVAGYMMAKRGVEIFAIHFVSPPYTSDRALQKVETLCAEMVPYCGRINFFCVPFTEIQEAIRDNCPEELFTIIMRRLMMKIAERIAVGQRAVALVTGESVAQVASQTMEAMAATDAVCNMPVFRPVIGMDKNEIIDIAKKIGTFETSILPYEDCCTVFTPKHPKTRPQLQFVEDAESKFDFEPLLEKAIQNVNIKNISG